MTHVLNSIGLEYLLAEWLVQAAVNVLFVYKPEKLSMRYFAEYFLQDNAKCMCVFNEWENIITNIFNYEY